MTAKLATGGKKHKLVNVHLLDGSEYITYVDVKSKFQEIFNQVTGHICLRETEYFGLAFKKDNEYQFVVLDEKIHKHAPKHWKSGPGEGVDKQGKIIMDVWFRVQFYVDQVILLREKVTRHQYYLQLKDNVLEYNHVYSEEKCFQQAAYALQADFGNYVEEKHHSGYFHPSVYFPAWILERHGLDYLAHNVPTLHRDLHNMTKNDAKLCYIRNASMSPGALNLHFYMVRKHKNDKHCNTWLAICARGVEIYEDDAGYKSQVSTFMWRDIGKLYFDKKKFEIRSVQSAGGRRFIYYTDCDIKSKYLLSISRSTHMFQMAIQPKLMEIQHLDNEDQKRYRESYVSSDPRDRSHFHHSPSTSTNASVSSNNQRLSVVSDASSNTTSGIVSDRMTVSFDDGDDHSREIMIDCPSQLPRQLRPKLQLFSSFNQSPHYSSQVSPNHSLELYKIEGMSGSTQELKSNTGCGSWHARHSHTSGCLLAHPSPYTHTQESKSCLQVMKSVTSKDSFGQHFHGSLLQTGDRNTSGDSAVSVSGVLVGPDKLSPISLLPSLEQQSWNNTSEDGLTTGMSTTFSPSFSHTPPLSQLPKKIHRSSSPPLVNLISTSKLKVSSSPRVLTVHKTLNPSPDAIEKSNSAPVDIPQEYERTWIPRCESEQVNRKSSNSPHELNKVCQPLESHSDVASEQQKESLSPDILLSVEQTKNSTNVPTTLDEDDDHLQTRIAAHDVLTNVPNKNQHDLLDATFHTENQHFVQAQVHESAEVNLVYRLQQLPPEVTDHYLMALQQGSEHLREQTISSQRQITELLPHHLSAVLHIQEQCHQTPYQELLQQQHDIQLLQHQQHQENQLQSEHMSQNIQYHPSDVQSADSSDYVEKMEENKENLNKRDRNEVDRNVQMAVVQSRSKGNLHPELKQILGQSHAFSLPLMTALCNDSSLMQASRSQSGSRSSYETSTMRSTDSRLTRLSHDTDSRRWSSCCQAANMADVLMMQSCRPYSWHSEHFELDSQSALPPSDHLPPTSPPNPRSINNKHLNMLNSHQSMLPQKMIVSDPGPSSPRLLTMGGETCWWEAPPSASELDGTLSSWTGIIPYSLPAQASHHMNNHIHHQKMVPHKLSSGGHRDSETSITHKQVMKENIGIA